LAIHVVWDPILCRAATGLEVAAVNAIFNLNVAKGVPKYLPRFFRWEKQKPHAVMDLILLIVAHNLEAAAGQTFSQNAATELEILAKSQLKHGPIIPHRMFDAVANQMFDV